MIKLNDHDRVLLRLEQRHRRRTKDYVKITTLLMMDSGFSAEETATALGIDTSTVYRFVQRFEDSGSVNDYLQVHYQGSEPLLSPEQIEILLTEMTTRLYRTAADVARFLKERFAVCYSPRGMRDLLNRLGFSYKKTRSVPAKADPIQQTRFLRRKLLPLLKRAKKRGEPVYFCDAVHPQYNTRPSHGWIAAAEEWTVPTTSGRQRLNIHAALNAHEPADVVAITSDRINTDSTIALFAQLYEHLPDARRIHLICDNASYYRSRDLRKSMRKNKSRIKITYLPTYAPNLNLIERLWKYLRREVIDTTYYASFKEFTSAILLFFHHIRDHQDKLNSLCALNFHIS